MRHPVPSILVVHVLAIQLCLTAEPAAPQEPPLVQLTFDPEPDISPARSPDGSKIAFASRRTGYYDIYVMPAAGEPPATRLTTHPANDLFPAWSPDGSRIAFISQRGGSYDIWTMPATGEPPTATSSPGTTPSIITVGSAS